MAAAPAERRDLEGEFGLARTEGNGEKLVELIAQPSLAIRGFQQCFRRPDSSERDPRDC
jgi:hypothetical protein